MRGEERARLREVPSLIPSNCLLLMMEQIVAQEEKVIHHDGDNDNYDKYEVDDIVNGHD